MGGTKRSSSHFQEITTRFSKYTKIQLVAPRLVKQDGNHSWLHSTHSISHHSKSMRTVKQCGLGWRTPSHPKHQTGRQLVVEATRPQAMQKTTWISEGWPSWLEMIENWISQWQQTVNQSKKWNTLLRKESLAQSSELSPCSHGSSPFSLCGSLSTLMSSPSCQSILMSWAISSTQIITSHGIGSTVQWLWVTLFPVLRWKKCISWLFLVSFRAIAPVILGPSPLKCSSCIASIMLPLALLSSKTLMIFAVSSHVGGYSTHANKIGAKCSDLNFLY